jgi:HMG (high mobility group) box
MDSSVYYCHATCSPTCLMSTGSNTDSATTTTWSSQQKGKYHGRGRPEGHIPRPPNASMLFRSDFLSKFPPSVTQQDKSRIAGMCWRQLPQAEVTQWTELAKEVKEAHYRKYPDFKYKPRPKGPVKRRRQARTREQQLQDCETLLMNIIPDKAGLIPQSSEPVPRRGKRKASHKSRASPQPSPHDSQEVVASGSTIPQPAQAFMDPLIPPPPGHATSSSSAASSSNYAQQEEELWASGLSLPTLDPVTYPFLTHDTPAPPPEDWGRGGYSHSALQSVLDALEQPTEPAAPLDFFEGTQCDPSGVLPRAFSQQGQTYTFPLPPPPHVYTSTFEWQKGVDQSPPPTCNIGRRGVDAERWGSPPGSPPSPPCPRALVPRL